MAVFWMLYFAMGYYMFWEVVKEGPELFANTPYPRFVFVWTACAWAIFLWPIPFAFAFYNVARRKASR